MSGLWEKPDAPVSSALRSPQLSPLHDCLVGSPDEVAVKRMWDRIEAPREDSSPRWVWRGAFGVAVAACIALLVFFPRAPAPLQLAHGGELTSEYASGEGVKVIPLSDGSHLKVHEDAELALLGNEGGVFLTAVRTGKVDFHVKPGGKRRWVVDAGNLSVEVVGTVFTVERTTTSASVSVTRGVVRVRGDVPGGQLELRAGDAVSVPSAREPDATPHSTGAAGAVTPASEDSREATDAAEPVLHLDDLPQEKPEEETTKGATTGEAPLPPNSARRTPSPHRLDSLLAEADNQLKAGDGAQAARLFARVVQEASSSDPRRGIAALSFARHSGDPVASASALELGLPSMPTGFREAALARLLSAYQASGQQAQVRRVAHLYLLEFPQGPRSALAKKLAQQP